MLHKDVANSYTLQIQSVSNLRHEANMQVIPLFDAKVDVDHQSNVVAEIWPTPKMQAKIWPDTQELHGVLRCMYQY